MSARELMPQGAGAEAQGRDLMSIKSTGLPPGVTEDDVRAQAGSPEEPTPEEQAIYDKFVSRAIAFIHGPRSQKAVLNMLNDPKTPVHVTVGKAAAKIGQLIEKSAKDAGEEVPPDVLYGAGQEVVENLMEVGSAAKIFPMDVESPEYQDALNMAFLEAVKAYGEHLLKGKDAKRLSEIAQDEYATQVAREADDGEIDPGFVKDIRNNAEANGLTPVADGVRRAINVQ